MTPASPRWLLAALLLGLIYLVVTPPGRVPDEPGHFWHAQAIVRGHFAPPHRHAVDLVPLPTGMMTLFWVMRAEGHKLTAADFKLAASIPHEPYSPHATPTFPTHYTPLAYVPQTAVALLARMTGMTPFRELYLGRIVNLLTTLALIAVAMKVAPRYATLFLVTALLPMTLYELASWSADAPAIGLGILFCAFMLEPPEATPRMIAAVAATAVLLSLSKPAYFLVALLALFRPTPRRIAIAALAATAVGIPIAMAYANYAWYNVRVGFHVDPDEQLRCLIDAPGHFVRVIVNDLRGNGAGYVDELIGRFGWLDVRLPKAIAWLEAALLAAVGLTAAPPIDLRRRLATIAILIATFLGIVASQYLTWTVVCADYIDGVQGRYFLPILPLALAALALPSPRWRISPRTIVAVAVIANAVGYVTLVKAYYG
ncbi:MAG: hypothetical protein JWO56_2118 [Acidobacteria bacterium]|nr:hypothetical protein [Acidobacteriota bacterium]